MEYLIKILEITAWPFTACLIAFLFKSDIHSIVQRISTIKYKDVEATLSNNIHDAEKKSKNIKLKQETDSIGNYELESRLMRILDISPKAAILEAWAEIEAEAFKRDFASGAQTKRVHPAMILEYIGENSRLSQKEKELLHELRNVRNRASHLPDIIIKNEDGEKYINVAIKAVSLLKQKTGEIK